MCIYRKGQCQCLSIFYPFYYLYYLAAARGPGPPCEVARDTLLWAWGQSQTFFERKVHFLTFFEKKNVSPCHLDHSRCRSAWGSVDRAVTASILIWFSFLSEI